MEGEVGGEGERAAVALWVHAGLSTESAARAATCGE